MGDHQKDLPDLKSKHVLDFVIVNGENAAGGRGITSKITIDLLRAGVSVITSGDHIWDQKEILSFINTEPRLLRPVNYPEGAPGCGSIVLDTAKGKIGVIYHEADFFVTRQRYEGFRTTIARDYPGISIVETRGIAGPDFAGDAQNVANAMLSKHPDLAGIWAVWDVPAEGVLAAARAAGRNDLKVATEDLGKNVAIALAKNQLVVGLGAQLPYDQGVTEANAGQWPEQWCRIMSASPDLNLFHESFVPHTGKHVVVPADAHMVVNNVVGKHDRQTHCHAA